MPKFSAIHYAIRKELDKVITKDLTTNLAASTQLATTTTSTFPSRKKNNKDSDTEVPITFKVCILVKSIAFMLPYVVVMIRVKHKVTPMLTTQR